MRFYFLGIAMIFVISQGITQLDLPQFSEPTSISQRVGNTSIELSYERPKQNERVIFGELVPYNQVWRTGAGECTKIRFNTPVYIDLKKIDAGYYSLFSIPTKDSWTFILNKDTTLYGSYDYNPELDVIRKKVPLKYSQKHYESMSLHFDVKDDIARLSFNWDHVHAEFDIHTSTYLFLLEQVDDVLENDYDIESNVYTNTADYIMHNRTGFGPNYLNYAERLLDKVFILGQPTSFAYRVKADILKLQDDKAGYMKLSKEHIKYLQDDKPYDGYEASIKEINERMKNYDL